MNQRCVGAGREPIRVLSRSVGGSIWLHGIRLQRDTSLSSDALKNNSQVTYQDYPLMIALGAETHGVLRRDVDGENEASPPINESHKMYYGTKTEVELKMLKAFHQ